MPQASSLPLRDRLARIDRRFFRFLVVGGVNTLFGYTVFAGLVYLHLTVAIALLLSTMVGVLFNFKTIGRLVFANPNNRLIGKFAGVYGIIYLVNLAMVKVLTGLHLGVYVAAALLLLPMAVLSFALNRTFVFAEGK